MKKILPLLFLLALCLPASAAVTNGCNVSSFSALQTRTCTNANAVSAGVLVVAFVFDGNTAQTGTTFTDSVGNTYTQDVAFSQAAGQASLQIFHSFITTPLTTSSTFTYTAATGFASTTIAVSVVSVPGYSSIDAATTNHAGSFSAAYSVTGAGSAAVANEIYFGFVFANGTLGATPTGWTTAPPNTPTAQAANFLAGWQINSGTSALTFNSTLTSQNWAVGIVSFKPSAGPTLPPQRTMTGVGQ